MEPTAKRGEAREEASEAFGSPAISIKSARGTDLPLKCLRPSRSSAPLQVSGQGFDGQAVLSEPPTSPPPAPPRPNFFMFWFAGNTTPLILQCSRPEAPLVRHRLFVNWKLLTKKKTPWLQADVAAWVRANQAQLDQVSLTMEAGGKKKKTMKENCVFFLLFFAGFEKARRHPFPRIPAQKRLGF